ncbi:MAG: pyridoxamine 5'-phosphate oxidase family protein, partial [Dolichospermum sp.]
MAKVFDFISEELQKFMITQKIFFVGTAPLSSTGH